jgi:hypothetical protein
MAMNTSTQLRFAGSTAPTAGSGQAEAPDKDSNVLGSGLNLIQRVAICFAAGVLGGLAVVLFSHLLFASGLSAMLGVDQPVPLRSPEIYRPLFWAGLWGIPFGLLVKSLWRWLYVFGLLYFLAPVLALFTVFLPKGALEQGGLSFAVYLVLVNLPYGIVTALVARAIMGKRP